VAQRPIPGPPPRSTEPAASASRCRPPPGSHDRPTRLSKDHLPAFTRPTATRRGTIRSRPRLGAATTAPEPAHRTPTPWVLAGAPDGTSARAVGRDRSRHNETVMAPAAAAPHVGTTHRTSLGTPRGIRGPEAHRTRTPGHPGIIAVSNAALAASSTVGSLRHGGGPGNLADPVMVGAAIVLAKSVIDGRQRVIRRRCIAR
jgi:hypothetical protein